VKELETRLDENRGGQMSFLEHLDELRKRLVNSVIIIVVAFIGCWFASDKIFDFLSVPIRYAISEAERRELPMKGLTGDEQILPLASLKEGDKQLYVFDRATKFAISVIAPGTSVNTVVGKDADGVPGLFTDEPIVTNNGVIPTGVRLPVDLTVGAKIEPAADERLIVTTAAESFTLLVTVSLYSAIAISVPLLLLQVWGFISPALYPHEKSYVTPFVLLSSVSFVLGAAFAYYVLFPPAVKYLLSLGAEFRLMLRATDFFDFIILIMLAMGIIFQMPAVTYVLARIGLVSAGFLIKSWKIAIVVILIVAALVSPTGDIPNLMLFALPMMVLYVFSIGIAWFFGKKRQTEAEA
jgi:sec-independent protein translocase protein TatC